MSPTQFRIGESNMKRNLSTAIASLVAATAFLGANPLAAQEARTPNFVGLWQGVDQVDGGYSVRSILPTTTGFRLVGRDTWHGPCGYGDPAVITGVLAAEDRSSIKGTWFLDCQAPPTAQTGDRTFKVRYTYDATAKTLTETLLDAQTEQPVNRIPIVFFRVAPQ